MARLSAYFLSLKRLAEILPRQSFHGAESASVADLRNDGMFALTVIASMEKTTTRWLMSTKPPSLGELLSVKNSPKPGTFFTHFDLFSGRGISDATMRFRDGKPLKELPLLTADLGSFVPGGKLRVQAHPENYTSASAPGEMSGKHRLFLLGRLSDVELPELRAQAYAIGHIHHVEPVEADESNFFGLNSFYDYMEVSASGIDSFAESAVVPTPTAAQLAKLEHLPEQAIKQAFAAIIGEPFIPKDWGGERSDLFSSRLRFRGKRATAAFLFKGPAKFKPLTVADLGKSGDQIFRLFSEPADLVVVQHCTAITTPVRAHMRAFATAFGRLRPFCLIDGDDTVRILRAYRQLGFSYQRRQGSRRSGS